MASGWALRLLQFAFGWSLSRTAESQAHVATVRTSPAGPFVSLGRDLKIKNEVRRPQVPHGGRSPLSDKRRSRNRAGKGREDGTVALGACPMPGRAPGWRAPRSGPQSGRKRSDHQGATRVSQAWKESVVAVVTDAGGTSTCMYLSEYLFLVLLDKFRGRITSSRLSLGVGVRPRVPTCLHTHVNTRV